MNKIAIHYYRENNIDNYIISFFKGTISVRPVKIVNPSIPILPISKNPVNFNLLTKISMGDIEIDDIKKILFDIITERCNIFKEELISVLFHPKNLEKWNGWGFNEMED